VLSPTAKEHATLKNAGMPDDEGFSVSQSIQHCLASCCAFFCPKNADRNGLTFKINTNQPTYGLTTNSAQRTTDKPPPYQEAIALPTHLLPADEFRMQSLLDTAIQNNQPFVAMLIDDNTGKPLALGINKGTNDLTNHSEMLAIRNWQENNPNYKGTATLYTTAEPCPMCTGAIVYANADLNPGATTISRVVFGTARETLYSLGWEEFTSEGTYENTMKAAETRFNVPATGGVLKEEFDALFTQYAPHELINTQPSLAVSCR
jgi:tRNA(adenine34) deaminase